MTTNNSLFFGTIAVISLLVILQTQNNIIGQQINEEQINEEILFPDFELPAEEKLQDQLPYTLQEEQSQQQELQQEQIVQEQASLIEYPEIPKPDANPECLGKCDTGFSLCLHRAQGDDKKTRKCYGSQEGCYTKCKEIA